MSYKKCVTGYYKNCFPSQRQKKIYSLTVDISMSAIHQNTKVKKLRK
jgi:hypothetical protein